MTRLRRQRRASRPARRRARSSLRFRDGAVGIHRRSARPRPRAIARSRARTRLAWRPRRQAPAPSSSALDGDPALSRRRARRSSRRRWRSRSGHPHSATRSGRRRGWLQRIIAHADRRWISSATEPRTQLGLNLFEAFGRIWLLAGAIVARGVAGGRADGLTAALVIFGAYSVAFAIRVITGPPQRKVAR